MPFMVSFSCFAGLPEDDFSGIKASYSSVYQCLGMRVWIRPPSDKHFLPDYFVDPILLNFLFNGLCTCRVFRTHIEMAKPKNIEGDYSDDNSSRYSQEEGSDVPSINNSAAELADRPAKRRRVSVSSNDSEDSNTENYTPIAPLPTISRIKKKGDVSSVSNIPSAEEPVSSRDARDIGLQVTDSTFATLNVAPWLVKSLSTLAIRRPTAIQKSCIPEILQGKDCIGGSRTGSGKTIAFAVPILQKWAEDPFGVYAVVLTPTR